MERMDTFEAKLALACEDLDAMKKNVAELQADKKDIQAKLNSYEQRLAALEQRAAAPSLAVVPRLDSFATAEKRSRSIVVKGMKKGGDVMNYVGDKLLAVGVEETLELEKRKVYDGKEGNVVIVLTFKRKDILTTAIKALIDQSKKETREKKDEGVRIYADRPYHMRKPLKGQHLEAASSAPNSSGVSAASSRGSPEPVLSGERELVERGREG